MSELQKKLQVTDERRGVIINPPADLPQELVSWPSGPLPETDHELDYVLVFVNRAVDVEHYGPRSIRLVRNDGLVWFAYPKKASKVPTDITRDRGWEPLGALGFRPVRQVSISEVWSGLRFREATKVK